MTATGAHRHRLAVVLVLTVCVAVGEAFGAWLSGSLALLADAGHLVLDAAGVTLALVAARLAMRPSSGHRTFGLQRTEILAAAANAILLLALAGYVIVEGIHRTGDPPPVDGQLMLAVAVAGLLANGCALLLLHRGSRESLNVRGAYLEVLGDLFGSAATAVAAVVVVTVGWTRADAVASVAVGLLILPRAWHLFREATDVLLESTPRGIDLDDLREHLLTVSGVVDVHDLHAWTITSGVPVVSAHVVVDPADIDGTCGGSILDQLQHCLADHFGITHSTLQLEPLAHRDHEHHVHP